MGAPACSTGLTGSCAAVDPDDGDRDGVRGRFQHLRDDDDPAHEPLDARRRRLFRPGGRHFQF